MASRVDLSRAKAGDTWDEKKLREQRRRTRKRRQDDGPFRRELFAGRGEWCRACGSTSDLQAAHIVNKSQGGPSIFEDGIVLCRTHHGAYDSYELQLDRGWLDPDQISYLAESGAVTWGGDGQPTGKHWRRFRPLTTAPDGARPTEGAA